MLEDIRNVYLVFLLAGLTYVFLKGSAPERFGAGTVVVMAITQLGSNSLIAESRFDDVDLGSLTTDAVGFVAFGILALNAMRYWPLFATALQLMCLAAHFARWTSLDMAQEVYAVMRSTPTAVVVALMVVATALHVRDQKRGIKRAVWQNWGQLKR